MTGVIKAVEWPTVALFAVTYAAWFGAVTWLSEFAVWPARSDRIVAVRYLEPILLAPGISGRKTATVSDH